MKNTLIPLSTVAVLSLSACGGGNLTPTIAGASSSSGGGNPTPSSSGGGSTLTTQFSAANVRVTEIGPNDAPYRAYQTATNGLDFTLNNTNLRPARSSQMTGIVTMNGAVRADRTDLTASTIGTSQLRFDFTNSSVTGSASNFITYERRCIAAPGCSLTAIGSTSGELTFTGTVNNAGLFDLTSKGSVTSNINGVREEVDVNTTFVRNTATDTGGGALLNLNNGTNFRALLSENNKALPTKTTNANGTVTNSNQTYNITGIWQ